MSYIFTQETPEALPAINAILELSIGAWNLSDRLYQLSVNAYRYSESDLIDHQFYGLRDQNNTLLAILVFNDDASEDSGDQSCLQIHGLCSLGLSSSRSWPTFGRPCNRTGNNQTTRCVICEGPRECRPIFYEA